MQFIFKRLKIKDVLLIEPKVFKDERGYFMETYKFSEFEKFGTGNFVQENQSFSVRGVLRGLHYQNNPYAQGKLVRAIKGKIFDVAVDIRKGSPTYGTYISEILSEENKKMLYIPEGFAHGFCTLSDEAIVNYLTTSEYAPRADRGIIWNDENIAIDWPIKDVWLSEKDKKHPKLKDADINFEYKE
ncbi:MAG: dTDP-4-dehydrorhamnose 3,5-epimerase [Candidatus Altiarchaeum hamiconexum]|uniref:dTDP-4-dehydrorhamnose 3,5-epimerase n=1 Tax=Candidatus Altarchaeum hamiconexum TaxID=1803513 RepID=A0A8J7YZY1_9ARCH|nr:dTDP-4-dehydrorhamnose 3,5-epimerase [Candidatus Altarchaeum hamiconexum]OIQ04808.1 MAG: dTDP-4-dehydrorhamnose 3,5-epimerase [Candidatus Altarchaeum sp. CG2_30_32_3053]PIN67438.1 MAG: dTDP-4-dehydrorhamnose 3,5-epimerase [Candidatus Altarchaeum sp. CG12_big_fil_rev_8_21_14_0_65_33_22]PIV27764.1 MAG: dTDP-4-dehydrorhamnose 3,5-epimerase [Candidatus Altarchaeum sp. CG03_land_8_20_14_0_80_32_618]PIX48308.1 MAG: dTDP-4-dehydrorhamnose 3,5-epimerase [Candidatus Altarchaeum sp. CG_4_8_14_3_um_fil